MILLDQLDAAGIAAAATLAGYALGRLRPLCRARMSSSLRIALGRRDRTSIYTWAALHPLQAIDAYVQHRRSIREARS